MTTTNKQDEAKFLAQLKDIGLHKTDAKVYLTSLRLGACTLKQLVNHTEIHRITAHDSIGRLIAKGLLLETFSGKRRLVFPEQISKLQHLVELKKAEVDQLQHKVSTTIVALQALHLQAAYLPKVRIMKGREGLAHMFREIKAYREGTIYFISDSWHFDELLNIQFLDSLVKDKNKKNVHMMLPPGFEHFIFSAKAKGLSIQTRAVPQNIERKGGMTIWGNTVALHAYEGVYITTTIIENSPIVHMMRTCYEGLRKIGG